jgi:hypothetical protein
VSTAELLEALRSMARGLDKNWRSRDALNGPCYPLINFGLVAWSYDKGVGAWRPTPAGEFCLLAFEEGQRP